MYNYELINNHYIVNIDGRKYLLDTGSPFSFWVSNLIRELTIDGNKYQLNNRPSNFNVSETTNLVGIEVDGFIGMDIISVTGLTIFKNGTIEFAIKEIGGIETPMTTRWPLMTNVGCNLMTGKFVIDTGAKYGYGVNGLFYRQRSFSRIKDYNPSLGHLEGDIYHLNVVIGGQNKIIDVCSNNVVASTLIHMGALMVGSVSSLYDEACVLDTKKGRLILK